MFQLLPLYPGPLAVMPFSSVAMSSSLLLWLELASGELLQPQRHRRIGIRERRDGGEMVGVRNRRKLRRDPGGLPHVNDAAALPEIFGTLVGADHRVQRAARRRWPEQRARGPRGNIVEL